MSGVEGHDDFVEQRSLEEGDMELLEELFQGFGGHGALLLALG